MSSLWNMFSGGSRRSQSQSQTHDNTLEQQQQQQQQSQQPSFTSSSAPPHPSAYTPSAEMAESFLQSSFADPAQLHPLAGLNRDTLEYLVLDDSPLGQHQSVIPTRGFFDDMCYGAGVCYLSGLGLGGVWGLRDGLARSANQPPRLRLNAVLNAVTRRGPFLGNSAGVVAIIYNIFSWSVGQVRGTHDAANTVLAGALSGMLFRSTRGLRPMMVSGGVVATAAGAWAVTRQILLPAPSQDQPSTLDHLSLD